MFCSRFSLFKQNNEIENIQNENEKEEERERIKNSFSFFFYLTVFL